MTTARRQLDVFLRDCNREQFHSALSGWLNELFPGISALIGCDQGIEHHREGDAAVHTWMVLDEVERVCRQDLRREPDFIERLAALLHDWKKPITRKTGADGSVTFPNHELMAASAVDSVATALDLLPQETEKLVYLIAYHGEATNFPFLTAEKQRAIRESPYVESLCALQKADAVSAHSATGGHWPVYWTQIRPKS
jgi:hypothetical protein